MRNGLTAIETDSGVYVKAKLFIQITDSTSKNLIVNREWNISSKIEDTLRAKSEPALMGLIGFVIPEGKFELNITGKDGINEKLLRNYKEGIKTRPFIGKDFVISDIQLAQNILKDSENVNSIFYKNTYDVIPNPSIYYTNASPVLFYYTELYNLVKNDSAKSYKLDKFLFNSDGEKIYQKSREIKSSRKSIVEVGILNLSKKPTGAYTLYLSLSDTVESRSVLSFKRFFLYNPGIKDSSANQVAGKNFMSSEFGVLTKEECDDLFDKSKYIASSQEIDQFEKLESIDSKREFLFRFWEARDPEPETPQNEFKKQYLERIQYADNRFSTFRRKGYKTDRGRVYVIYGETDQIDRYPNETSAKPYEIWYYNSVEGGVVFVFGDLTGFSDYELIHSTKRGELRDDDWMRRISTN